MMVGLKISSDDIQEIINILGLTEEQGKTYLSLLSLGTATLGQISLLSGLDYIQTQEALQLLIGSNLVKRIAGKVGRYVALEPFLKTFFLAYDPITLVNIRNESANAFKTLLNQLDDIIIASAQTLQHNAKNLEADFSQSLSPVRENFKELVKNLRDVIKSSESRIHENMENLQSKINIISDQLERMNNEIKSAYFAKVEKIPDLFKNQIPISRQKLSEICQESSNELFTFKKDYKSELESLKTKNDEDLAEELRKISSILDKFEDNRYEEKRNFEDKISGVKLSLEKIRLNVAHKKSNFQNVRIGYGEIDEAIKELFGELNDKVRSIEPIIIDSITDIQNRKMFRGKDEFIAKLNQIEDYRKKIEMLIAEKSTTLKKVDKLNDTLNETENEIVEAADTGIQNVKNVLDEEVQVLTNDIENIRINMGTIERKTIQKHFEGIKDIFNSKTNAIDEELNHKIDNFNQKRDENVNITLDKLSTLTKKVADEFKTNLLTLFDEKGSFDRGKDDFRDTQAMIDDLSSYSNRTLKETLENVLDAEKSYDNYLIGLNTFTSSFADTQLNTFISALNRGKRDLNSQVTKIENQLEQEISALVFTIKEMQQKLKRIVHLSRLAEISEIEPSLLSSDLVVGESVIIMLLRDLTVRAKSSLTILMPRPELQTLIAASKLPMKVRVNIIGDFAKVPKSTLKKVLSANNVRLKQLDGIDYWGSIRDSEELLICPEPKDPTREKLIGVITTNENLVELFSQEIITYTTRSREILLQDLN